MEGGRERAKDEFMKVRVWVGARVSVCAPQLECCICLLVFSLWGD